MSKLRLARDLQTDSVVDGEGLRVVLWLQGCKYACPGCHNESTWSIDGGFEVDSKSIIQRLQKLDYHDGLTLSGGEPLLQAESLLKVVKSIKARGKNIWCYSGATFQELIQENNVHKIELLKYIDVLIDGRFILDKKSLETPYRGSSNQRLIDVQAYFKTGLILDYKLY